MLLLSRFNAASITFATGENLCNDWLKGYSLSNAIIQATAILIIVLNIVIIAVLGRNRNPNVYGFFIVLSKFQRYHTKTEEKASSIIKMFLIQLINTVSDPTY